MRHLWKRLIITTALLGTTTALLAKAADSTFMPPNHLDLQDDINRFVGGLTQEEFNRVIDRAVAVYAPIITAHGGRLVVNRRWTDATVNANATQIGNTWTVNMYGGLARRPEVTSDGFALVLCHELGHHLGGFPFVQTWAANEGQSDYFATLSCAGKVWQNDPVGDAAAVAAVAAEPKQLCDNTWLTESARTLCYRSMLGGKSLADLLGALGESSVSYTTPDTSVVTTTNNDHPEAQCRLDTYMAGALCTQAFDSSVIPGKASISRNGMDAERDSALYSCTASNNFTVGKRPACWFKARL